MSLLPLGVVVAVINALGWQDGMRLRDALTVGVFAVFSLLMAREAVLAIEAGRGRRREARRQAGTGMGDLPGGSSLPPSSSWHRRSGWPWSDSATSRSRWSSG